MLRKWLVNLDVNSKEILKGSALAFLLRILGALLGLISTILITRALGSEQSGYYFLALAVVTFLTAFGSLGLNNTLLRVVATESGDGNWTLVKGAFRSATSWCFISSLLVGILLFSFSEEIAVNVFGKLSLIVPIEIVSIALLPIVLFSLHSYALQGLKEISKSMTINGISMSVFIVIGVSFFQVSSAIDAVTLYTFAALLTFLVGLVFWKRSIPKCGVTCYPSSVLWQSCMPLLVLQIVLQINALAGQFMLGVWAEADDVAHFAVALKIATLISFVLVAVNRISAPKFAQMYHSGDMDGLARVVRLSTRLMLVLSTPPLLLIFFAPEYILSVFGDDFSSASPMLMLLALGEFVNVATGSVAYLLIMTGHERQQRNNLLIVMGVSLCIGLFLVPIYGGMGAAIMTFIALSMANILAWYQVKKRLGINTLKIW